MSNDCRRSMSNRLCKKTKQKKKQKKETKMLMLISIITSETLYPCNVWCCVTLCHAQCCMTGRATMIEDSPVVSPDLMSGFLHVYKNSTDISSRLLRRSRRPRIWRRLAKGECGNDYPGVDQFGAPLSPQVPRGHNEPIPTGARTL